MKISLARKIILGALVLALAAGGAVYVLAQDESTTDTETSACIDELEANGDLTAEQAAALRAVIETGAGQAMRDAMGRKSWGKSGHFGWSKRGGRGGPGIDMRRFFGGRGIPIMPDLFGKNLFGDLDKLFEELEESGSLDEAMRERLEQLEEALRSGARGRFGFRIDRDDEGKWHFDWFGDDDTDSEEHPDDEDEDPDASANNSA